MSVRIRHLGAVGLLLALALGLAGRAAGAGTIPQGYTPQQWRAELARSRGLDARYHLGSGRQGWLSALRLRSIALDRKYHLGRYALPAAPVRAVPGFDWDDAGIGSAATVGVLLVAGGVVAGVRRYRGIARTPTVRTP